MTNGSDHPKFKLLSDKIQGTTVYIIGGGSSINDFPLLSLQDKSVIAVNNAYQFPFARICWFGDERWHNWHSDKLKSFQGTIATCHPRFYSNPDYIVFKRGKPQGIETKQNLVSWNNNSGGSAINFAYHLKAKRIVLVGFDMAPDKEGNNNYHKDHKYQHKGNPYRVYMESFTHIARDAEKLKLEIINANPESKLTVFPKVSAKEAIEL